MFEWLVSDLPPEFTVCELDCRLPHCRHEKFDWCECRLRTALPAGHDAEPRPVAEEQRH